MKNYVLLLAILVSAVSYGQQKNDRSQFGIKAGLNYNSNGELKEILTTGENLIENRGEGKVGFHVGFYGQLDFSNLYLRPELIYTRTTSEYGVNNATADYKTSKIDLPILLGYKIIGPLRIFAGPAFQYTLQNDLDLGNVDIDDVENEISVGLHIGAGVQLGNLGLDVRFERGFNENEANFINTNIADDAPLFALDSRPTQLIFSASFRL